MNELASPNGFGVMPEPATLRIERLLPGPIERVWSYLTDGDKRRQWLAAGDMTLEREAEFELVWRNDELTDPPGERPATHSAESRMTSRVVAVDPPRGLTITWGKAGEVEFALAPQGSEVLLTLVHRRIPDRSVLLSVSSGWHMHLDILASKLAGTTTEPFWDGVKRLKAEYERRFAG